MIRTPSARAWRSLGGFDGTSAGLRGSGKAYSRAQTGDAHSYLRAVALGHHVDAAAAAAGARCLSRFCRSLSRSNS